MLAKFTICLILSSCVLMYFLGHLGMALFVFSIVSAITWICYGYEQNTFEVSDILDDDF